jgi:hypothetical protein
VSTVEAGRNADWSPPDANGLQTQVLDVGARSTLRGRRRRRGAQLDLAAVALWPDEWRGLLRDWLAACGNDTARWKTLVGRADQPRFEDANALLEALLRAGLFELDEKREAGRWLVTQVRFVALESLRGSVGLPDRVALREQWSACAAQVFSDSTLALAAERLSTTPLPLALRRHALLGALERWAGEARSGTRREFAEFAGRHTKDVAESDWIWLEANVDLEGFGVRAHRSLLMLRAPLQLLVGSRTLDLAAVPDCIGLSPALLAKLDTIYGTIINWRLVENRTSFEHAATCFGHKDAVVWLPGYPPAWWRACMHILLLHRPAQAMIACDPDPAGIEIALQAGAVWDAQGLAWQAWQMGADQLDRIRNRLPLTSNDRRRLKVLRARPLPADLAVLATALEIRGYKGEQESYALE